MLEHALLHLLEVEMILVEDASRVLEVEVVLGGLIPGQRDDPVQVGSDDAVLGRCGRELLEPRQLALDRLVHAFGQRHRLEARSQLIDFGLVGVALA